MKVKIIAPDAVGAVKEVSPEDGQRIPVAPGEIVQFEGKVPVVAVPVGLDLVVFFEDGSSVVLEGFFAFEEGEEPPSIDLGEGKSFIADYSFQADEGPVGFYFGQSPDFNPEGFEPFPLSAVGGLGLGDFAAARVAALGDVLRPVVDGLTDEVQRLTDTFALGVIGTVLGPGPLACVDGEFHVGKGSGSLTLTKCNDFFTVTTRSNNTIRAIDGDDFVRIEPKPGTNQDVQDNVVIGGNGNDTVLLRAVGLAGNTDNDSDVERNIILGDGQSAAAGNDKIYLQATTRGGDVGNNIIDGGDGDNTVSILAFGDAELNRVNTGSGIDSVSIEGGRSYFPGLAAELMPTTNSERFSVVALNLPGGSDLVSFDAASEGMTFDVLGDAGLDNVSWVDRSEGSHLAVLALDRDGDGQISGRDEIDFGLPGFQERGLAGIGQEFDSNDDGVFDARDARFGDFVVWQDGNGDGRGVGNELRSLADLGITSINLETDDFSIPIIAGEVDVNGRGTYQETRSFRINSDFVIETATVTGANVVLAGMSGLPNALVRVVLDLDQDGDLDVGYEVMSNAAREWTLDTAVDIPVAGAFFEPTGAEVNYQNVAIVTDADGHLKISGVSMVVSGTTQVRVDLDLNNTTDATYTVVTNGAGEWSLDTAVNVPEEPGGFPTVFLTHRLLDLSLLAIEGGESSGREDNQNNFVDTGGGNDRVDLIAHQDVQSNAVFTGDGDDIVIVRSDIDDVFTNEIFLGTGNDAATVNARENVYDNVVILGGGEDTARIWGDRILENVIESGDASSEIEYVVTAGTVANADGLYEWTLNTGATGAAIAPGVHFDVNAEVRGETVEVSGVTAVVEILDEDGRELVPGGNIDDFGNLTLSEADVDGLGLRVGLEGLTVTVVLVRDAGIEGADPVEPVEYEVTSGPGGDWSLNTGEQPPSGGVFVPLTEGGTFTLRVTAAATDTVIENQSGVNGGGRDIGQPDPNGPFEPGVFVPDAERVIDIDDVIDATTPVPGNPVLSGTVALFNATVMVELDLDQSGVVDAVYEVTSDEAGNWTVDTAVANEVSGSFVTPAIGQPYDVSATAYVVDELGQVMVSGVSTVTSGVVTVGLDLDQNGADDFIYEVLSDENGRWLLNTAVDTPTPPAAFTPLLPGQEFNISADLAVTTLFGFVGGYLPIISGTSAFPGASITVSLDLLDGTDPGDQISLRAIGEINNNEVLAGAGDDVVQIEVSGEAVDRSNPDKDVADFVGGVNGNTVHGRGGNDTIEVIVSGDGFIDDRGVVVTSDATNNLLRGGIGNDRISILVNGAGGDANHNTLEGGSGVNTLTVEALGGGESNANFNVLEGGSEGDTMRVSAEALAQKNILRGGDGDNSITIESTGTASGGFMSYNTIESGSGNDTVRLTSESGFVYGNSIAVSGGDDSVTIGGGASYSAQYLLQVQAGLDGGSNGIAGDSLVLLNGGDIYSNGVAVNFETLDVTNGEVNAVTASMALFDGLTGGGDKLTILGDAGIDAVDLSSGEWDFVVNDSGLNEYVDNVADDVTRTLFVQDDLMTTLPAPMVLDLEEGGGAGGAGEELEIDFGRLASVSGGDSVAAAAGVDGVAGLVAEQLLDVSGSQYAGVFAAVDSLGNGDGGAITPLEMSMARVGGDESGMEALVGSPGPLVEGEAALDDGLVMA